MDLADTCTDDPGTSFPRLTSVPTLPAEDPNESCGRHPTGLGASLDSYLAAVADALQELGIIAGPPRRTSTASHLVGSIVIDCSALYAGTDDREPAVPGAGAHPGGAGRLIPVLVVWDETHGWAVGLHHDSAHSSRHHLHPDLIPSPSDVAAFVADLARRHTTTSPLAGGNSGAADGVRAIRGEPSLRPAT